MALAEARAAWQRRANGHRWLVQEDAKKLACCPCADIGPNCADHIHGPGSLQPFSRYSNNSKWWMQIQHNSMETCQQGNQCRNLDKKDSGFMEEDPLWIGTEKNNPWWDTEELALFIAKRSLDHIDNCDLPTPQNLACFPHDGTFQMMTSADKPLREMHTMEKDTRLLEALRHSQTRAREAEKAAKQACAEKDHIVKLVFKQASQLFAYKQWLQLENMSLQFKNNNYKSPSISPIMLQGNRKSWQKSYNRKRAKRSFHRYDVSNYAVVFAFGLGLVGAGLLLGWTAGWMTPTW